MTSRRQRVWPVETVSPGLTKAGLSGEGRAQKRPLDGARMAMAPAGAAARAAVGVAAVPVAGCAATADDRAAAASPAPVASVRTRRSWRLQMRGFLIRRQPIDW